MTSPAKGLVDRLDAQSISWRKITGDVVISSRQMLHIADDYKEAVKAIMELTSLINDIQRNREKCFLNIDDLGCEGWDHKASKYQPEDK